SFWQVTSSMQGKQKKSPQIPPLLQSIAVWQLPSTQVPLTQMWFGPYPARQVASLAQDPQVCVLPSQICPGGQSFTDWQPPVPPVPAPAPPVAPTVPPEEIAPAAPPLAFAPAPPVPPLPLVIVAPPVAPPEAEPAPPVPVAPPVAEPAPPLPVWPPVWAKPPGAPPPRPSVPAAPPVPMEGAPPLPPPLPPPPVPGVPPVPLPPVPPGIEVGVFSPQLATMNDARIPTRSALDFPREPTTLPIDLVIGPARPSLNGRSAEFFLTRDPPSPGVFLTSDRLRRRRKAEPSPSAGGTSSYETRHV